MSVDEERLIAFADGELTAVERAELEAALADDESLREKLAAHRRLRARLSAAFDGALAEGIPARFLSVTAKKAGDAEIVSLTERRTAKWSAREWGAMAASVAAGLLIGVGAMNAQTPLVATTDRGLEARGPLAHALNAQLASDVVGAVRIGLTFRTREGGYCRTFDLTGANTSGLACREGARWNVAMTAANAAGGEVRMAGASEQILRAVDAIIEGEPLDADDEARARAADWR